MPPEVGCHYRQYSDDDKATALAFLHAHDGNTFKTARELDIPETTLRSWRNGIGVHPCVVKMSETKKVELSDLFEQVARLYLVRAAEEDAIQESTGKEAVTAAAIAIDKMRLLREQATSIQQREKGILPDELLRRIRAALLPAPEITTGPLDPRAIPADRQLTDESREGKAAAQS